MRYNDEFKSFAVEYYLATGSYRKASSDLGIAKGTLHLWVSNRATLHPDEPSDPLKEAVYPKETIRLVLGLVYGPPNWKLKEASDVFNIPISTIHSWKKRYLDQGKMPVPQLEADEIPSKRPWSSYKQDWESKETAAIEIHKLKMQVAVLQETIEVLKGAGIDDLSNEEKAEIIDALKGSFRLSELLMALDLSSSSYYYRHYVNQRTDKYIDVRRAITEEFKLANGRRGYRYIHQRLRRREKPIYVSEKVVRRLMAEEGLSVAYAKKRRKWSSYLGEISEAPKNLVKRNFHAERPNNLWLTDITEFKIKAGKVYLSPVLDCFDGALVAWTIGEHPTAELANESLRLACRKKPASKRTICHSDRGGHYRWDGWIEICEKNNLIRSMSKKGCSPDNSAMEGFFGRLKNEFFYYNDWDNYSLEEFSKMLDDYLNYYNSKRPKESLGWLSPSQYRKALGFY